MRLLKSSVVLLLFYVLSGCVIRSATTISPEILITKKTSFYVVRNEQDTHDIDQLIKDKLFSLGYEAKNGPAISSANHNADIIVTYRDRWKWDMTMFMVELSLAFRHPENDYLLATSKSRHSTLARKSPEGMVNEGITNIFRKIESKRGRTGNFDSTQKPTVRIETDDKIKQNINVKGSGDLYTEIKKLKELKDSGIITEPEFQAQKKKLLEKY